MNLRRCGFRTVRSAAVRSGSAARIGIAVAFLIALPPHEADAQQEPEAKQTERVLHPSSDPAVKSLLATNPTTPEELLGAIDVLLSLRAFDDAYLLLQKLDKAKPGDDEWVKLVEKLGSGLFVRLALLAEMQPEGRQISDAALNAADKYARDPNRLAELIGRLSDPSPAVRRGAMLRLLSGREAAIQALVSALRDPARKAECAVIRTALVRFGRDATAPLVAVLRSNEAALRVEACRALAELGQSLTALDLLAPALLPSSPPDVQAAAKEALVALVGRVPQRDEAVSTLIKKAKSGFEAVLEEPDLEASPVPQWHWNEEKSALDYALSSPLAGNLNVAASLATDAARLAPRSREAVLLSLAARVEAEAFRAGLDQPVPAGRDTAGPDAAGPDTAVALLEAEDADVLDAVLDYALVNGHTVAATAAARALGKVGKREVLYRWQPKPGSLVAAAQSGDRRLRYAALGAIMGLKPQEPYPGSSVVIEALGYLAGSFAAPRAIVADARTAEVERQAGLLAALGYETDAATNQREVLSLAISSPDYVLALVDYTLAGPTSGELIQQLRRDNRTARLPIGIIASTDDLEAARRLARRTPLAAIIYRPVDAAGLEFQLALLLATAGQRLVPAEERQQQARQALDWLVQIATDEQKIYNSRWTNNLRRIEPSLAVALQVPDFSSAAARVLATLGTANSQKTLVDLASQFGRPEEVRQLAAKAFADSVARFGTLLTTGEINLQYTRYNQSERQDAQTQAVLASILDAMEARAAAEQTD